MVIATTNVVAFLPVRLSSAGFVNALATASEMKSQARWDEAFYPVAARRRTRGDEHGVVVGSLREPLACPGPRSGHILGQPEFVAAGRVRQPVCSLDGLACEAVAELLDGLDLERVSGGVGQLREGRRTTRVRHALSVRASDAPGLVVDQPGRREALIGDAIVVRDDASVGLDGVAPVAVPDHDGIERLGRAPHRLSFDQPAPVATMDRNERSSERGDTR